jgi:LAS superfamily LD-carboxypeptidase LdcB
VGNVVANVAQGLDFRNQYNLREDIRTGVEIIRDQYGVNAGSDTADGSLFNYDRSPEGLNQANEEIDRLTQAYQNGTLRESYYYAQLNSLVRSVKSRYPGYEDEIDQSIASITGVDPANAYISQLRQEALADASSGSDHINDLEDYIKSHEGELELIYPGFNSLPAQQQLALVEPGAEGNLRSRVANYAASTANINLIREDVERGAIDATQGAVQELAEAHNLFLDQLNIGIEDGSLVDPEEVTRQLLASGAIEDPADAVQYLQGLMVAQRANYDAIINDERYSEADRERLRGIADDYVGTMNFYIETMMNGDTGIAALAEQTNNLRESAANIALDDAFGGTLTFLRVIQKSVPPAFLDIVVQRNLGPLANTVASMVAASLNPQALANNPEIGDFWRNIGGTPAANGAVGVNQVAQGVTNLAGGDADEAAEALRATIDLQLDVIRGTNGVTANPAQVQEALTFLFGTDGGFDFSIIPSEEHQDIYALLTSPSVAQAAATAGGEVQLAYENWAVGSFRDINFQTISDLNNNLVIPGFTDTFDLVFNQATAQLEVRPHEGINFHIGRNLGDAAADPGARYYAAYVGLQDNVDKLNQSLSSISHLFEANGEVTMGGPEFTGLLPAQINTEVQFVNEPSGLGGLVPLETPDATLDPTTTPIEQPVNPAQAAPNPNEPREDLGTTFTGGAPNTPDGQRAPLPMAPPQNIGERLRTPNPTPSPLGEPTASVVNIESRNATATEGAATTATSGDNLFRFLNREQMNQVNVENLPDDQMQQFADRDAELRADQDRFRNMGWNEINALDANTLTPDQRQYLGARVQELTAAGDINPAFPGTKENVTELKDLTTDQAKEESKAFEEAAKNDPSNTGYATISRILLEPDPQFREIRLDNNENTVVTGAVDFLEGRLAPGHDDTHITNMQPELQTNLTNFFQGAPPEIAQGLGILSGYRSVERQRELWNDAVRRYGSEAAASRWVARPGSSQHNHGNAADLTWNGESLAQAPAWVVNWLHTHAAEYGLVFPLSNENWHVELIGARG